MHRKTKPQTDYSDPENSLGYLTRIAFRSFSRELEKLTLPSGVTAGQWRFLRALWVQDGINQRELSRRVVMREPTTVIALKGMEKAGMVRRETCAEDRRRSLVFLTAKGKALQKELMPCVVEVNERATASLDDAEVAQLKLLLRKICEGLSDENTA
jgi:MarR family transcriptional regulator, transcriptional regulator for hemolysin